MKKIISILKKTIGFTVIISLCLGVFFFVSCEKSEQEPPASNVSFTPCRQEILKSSTLSDKVEVEFADKGVQIKHYNFAVTCDFTAVNVSHTFVNGVLSITQQGSPNQAKCTCYTDVSYTISGISKDEVNVIFINGVQVYCYNEKEFNTNIVLKMNESFAVPNTNNTMTVSFVKVDDSRCAKSQCHLCYGSFAEIRLSVIAEEKMANIDLSIIGCVAYDEYGDFENFVTDTLGYRFQLVRLSPYPDIEPINESDYIAKIKITKL